MHPGSGRQAAAGTPIIGKAGLLIILAGAALTTLTVVARQGVQAAPKPNIVLILADEGKVFTDAHAGAAVCTPMRYGRVTGRYSWRTRLTGGVVNGYSRHLIDPNRQTVAGLLKQAGYHTACIGKGWHFPRINSRPQ